jgi:hypothetical protein
VCSARGKDHSVSRARLRTGNSIGSGTSQFIHECVST